MNIEDLTDVQLAELRKALTPKMSKYCPWEATAKQTAFLLMNDTKEVLYGGAAGRREICSSVNGRVAVCRCS